MADHPEYVPGSILETAVNRKMTFSENKELRDWIGQEIRLAMQQQASGKLTGGIDRAAVADIRAARILAKLDGYPVTHLTEVDSDTINSVGVQLVFQTALLGGG